MKATRTMGAIASLLCATTLVACNETAPPAPATATAPVPVSPPDTSIPPLSTTPAHPQATAGGKDTPANAPMEPLSKDKELNSMPLAGQANGHSSPSIDASAKR
jgi:hypothetical protein